jgi:DNA invertase Pin-like site-specific DNA recombinase
METAYLYVRVSTDEQKRKGYSLVEQEERLIQYCEINNLEIKGVFREDYSAKDFNRPEWKKLIVMIKKKKHRHTQNILFLKWDRFSRNIQYAYQMMGILKSLNVQAMAIDQPIDFEIPESIVMLAVYLSIPEAENHRRGLNTSDGMRRAKKMGRWAGKAPIGYINLASLDGKKFIAPKQPEADHIKWSFKELVKGRLNVEEVRRMACANGFQCGKTNFWKLIRNPMYCGIITLRASKIEELQFIKGDHQPLISESLFYEVQAFLNSRRRIKGKKKNLFLCFPLRGFLICPFCRSKLTGSFSQGKKAKYAYYHCAKPNCKGRFRADKLNESYEDELKKIRLRPEIHELFNLILEDENIYSTRKLHMNERKSILDKISKQQNLMSTARRFYLSEKIDFEDFGSFKKENNEISGYLNSQLKSATSRLLNACRNYEAWPREDVTVFHSYANHDIEDKRNIISIFMPSKINPITKKLAPIQFDDALSLVISYC